MSEDSVKINGAVQVGIFMVLGALYIGLLYFISVSMESKILDNSMIVSLTAGASAKLREFDHNSAMVMVVAGMILLSVITGMLISDMVKKFTVISPVLLFVITAVDFIPIKIITAGF